MVTKEQVILAGRNAVFHEAYHCMPTRVVRWRANGQLKTWKRSPERFQLPIKWGLHGYAYLTEGNAGQFHLASECPVSPE